MPAVISHKEMQSKILGELRGPKALSFMRQVMARIERHVQLNLTGEVLRVRSGRLRGSITVNSEQEGDTLVGRIGSNVFYAAIWEFTGHKAYTVYPKTARALRIPTGRGKAVFAMYARIPAVGPKPFIRPAINEVHPFIQAIHAERFKKATETNIEVRIGPGQQ